MADDMKRDWRELCAVATNESDSTKLSSRDPDETSFTSA